ncbi:aminodeoxychorismate synthase component I [Nonlabens spongiae]|uniref:Aminodeoxychorismate synthase component I n=1 Tax=Nonlabens spongiae TaxID=331648 RepID=A0A1W6MI00_9FLAO|nr:anthranilate synthase component I family protein [Nonlabens spongiae]ARN77225.1 aminodeoxychorismate synthase component I [Nonlabens spongiae]
MSKRSVFTYDIDNSISADKLLGLLDSEPFLFYLDSNDHQDKNGTASILVATGARNIVRCDAGDALSELSRFRESENDWIFGWLGYDLKNELENLESKNTDPLEFPDLMFVVPERVFQWSKGKLTIHTYEDQAVIDQLINDLKSHQGKTNQKSPEQTVRLTAQNSKNQYLKSTQKFLKHIKRGDIYEANYCMSFLADDVEFDEIQAYHHLNNISKPPFSALVRCGDFKAVSASPERYLKNQGNQLLSQPIKGTARRHEDPEQDEIFKKELFENKKERSENVMIVDLVRNDLSRVAQKGSVQVDELYGIYTFKQVHHMISSITADLQKDKSGIDAIKATFPMGSMTGAPKVSAMKIIDENENFKRGLYSGAIGYFDPDGNFDFNVVIRTILYNAQLRKLSFAVGSAITIEAVPEKEYEECFLKAHALLETLKKQGITLNDD